MSDTALSKYIQQKRERDVFTDPAFDRLTEPSTETATPQKGFDMLEVPKYTPPTRSTSDSSAVPSRPKIGSVQKAILAQKAKNSGFSGEQIDAAVAIAENVEGGARFVDANMPGAASTVYSESMPPADIWSSIAKGFHNTFVSAGAGAQQLMLGLDGSKDEVEKIRQWQKDNEAQISKATKRMLADSELNSTKFGFGVGNAVGSVAISLAPALALAPFGVGIVAASAVGAAASYPMIFNSTFNSAIDAGYSPQDAATYAHIISVPISAVEMIPIAKLNRTLSRKVVSGVLETAVEKYLPKAFSKEGSIMANVSAISNKIAKDGLSDDMLVNVYRSVNNGIKDRLLVGGGTTAANAATEFFTESIQNYMERLGEVGYDNIKGKKGGEGFGTTMEDVTSLKQFKAAVEDGMYGAIAGGGASILSIGKPLYEEGVYNTLAKFDQKGRLDEGIQKITDALQAKVNDGSMDQMTANQAIKSIQQVSSAYKKLGNGIADPKIKAAMYYGVRKKDMLTEDIDGLEKKKAEIEAKIGLGEVDPDIAKFEDDQINGLIELKNKQFAFTSDWLKETASQIYANKINAAKGEMANTDIDMDNLASDANKIKSNQSTWRKAMGFTPQFASARVGELSKSLEDIRKEYEASSGLYGQESLMDKNIVTEFDEFESATKIVVDKEKGGIPKISKGKFVSDGDGNYAVELEQTDADGKKTKAYRPIPKSEYYNKRLSEIFSANKQFASIADKMVKNEKLTDEEKQIADDFDVDVQEVFQQKKQVSDKKVEDFLSKVVYSDDPLSAGDVEQSNMEDFEKKSVMDSMSRLKIVAPSIKKFIGNGNSKALKSVISKNPQISNVLQSLSEDEAALDKFLKNNPAEKKTKVKPAAKATTGATNQPTEHSQEEFAASTNAEAQAEDQLGRDQADADTMRRAENPTKAVTEESKNIESETKKDLGVGEVPYEKQSKSIPVEVSIPEWVDTVIERAKSREPIAEGHLQDAIDYIYSLYTIWSKAKQATNKLYIDSGIDEVVSQIESDIELLTNYMADMQEGLLDVEVEAEVTPEEKKPNTPDSPKAKKLKSIKNKAKKKAELKEEIADYLQENDTTATQNDSDQAEAEGAQSETQLGGVDLQPALGTAIQATDTIVETFNANGRITKQVLSDDVSEDSAISELERGVEEINRQADEISEQQSGNQGSSPVVSEKQGSGSDSSREGAGRQTASEVISDSVREGTERINEEFDSEYEAEDRLKSKELRDFVDTIRNVFKIDIEVISPSVWRSLGLDGNSSGVFIGSQGKVILRSDATKGIAIHELGHVAVSAIKKSSRALYDRALESVRGTIYEEMVRKLYPNLKTDEEVLREALGYAIQDKGESILNGEGTPEQKKSLFNKITDYIKRIFRNIAQRIGLNVSPEFDLTNMSLEQFSNEIASKILSGNKFESAFGNFIAEYQPDPTDPNEYNLYGNHKKTAHQAPQMPSLNSGVMVDPEMMFGIDNFIKGLEDGTVTVLSPQMVSDTIREPFEQIINSAKNQKHKWTKLTARDLYGTFANTMYNELYSGGGVQNKTSAKLLSDLKDLSRSYSKWVRSSHVRVIDMSSGSPVESYSYIDHVEESKLANDKVNELKAANKGFFGKINQFFLNNYFTDLFGIETVSEFLGGENGILGGIHGLIRRRNNDAATFARYAHNDIENYKTKLKGVFGLNTASDYFKRKVSISAFNNMDGNPAQMTMEIPLGMAADIYVNYKTQSLNSYVGNDPTHSSIYYDPNMSGRGAKDVRGKDIIYRGITQTIEDNEYNLLFDASGIAELENMFGSQGAYEFMAKDAFDFYSGMAGNTSRFDMIDKVYVNVKGESLRKIPNGTYAPTRAYNDSSNASHRTFGAAYDDISFIKTRTDLPSRLQGSRDVLSAMESYSQRAQNFIRNAEAAESLLVYERRVKDRWNNNEMQAKLDWVSRYRHDLNSYEQDRIIEGIKQSRLGIPLVSYRTIMSNFAKSVFAFNLANPLKQGAGYLGAYGLGVIENKYLNKYKGFVTKSIAQSYKGYFGGDDGKFVGTSIPLDFKTETDLLREMERYDEMSDIWLRLEDITSNTQGVPVQDIYSAYNSGQKGQAIKQFLGEKWDTITRYGLSPMRHSDRAPILAFYLAAKDQVSDMANQGTLLDSNGNRVAFSMNINGVEVMTPEAVRLVADKVTEVTYRTNNMYMSNDKTGLQRSHGFFHETIGMFSSQPQKIFNLFLNNMFKAARGNFADSRLNNLAMVNFGYAVVASAALTASITVAYSVMKNGGLDDDDDLKRDFLVEMSKNIIGIAPSGGTEVLMSLLSMFDTRASVDASAQNPVFEQITKVIVGLNAYKDSFDAKTEETETRLQLKAASSMSSGVGSMVGVPSSFIKILNSELLR